LQAVDRQASTFEERGRQASLKNEKKKEKATLRRKEKSIIRPMSDTNPNIRKNRRRRLNELIN